MMFTVFGNPIPKARPRVTRTGHTYTPKTTKDFEFLVKNAWNTPGNRKIELGPIEVTIEFFLKRPKKPKHVMPTSRPDLDNMCKGVLDALNGLAWADDSQVVSMHLVKYYASETLGNGQPRTEINIRRYV